ncbi:polyphosphate--nucleotide phosphotransferase [Domibacillus sp. DTU_2020_1001157_1_SI_ALB_TIR_016]|uniref:PPK2 family polyphosphate kinase n=1 Tax=Domibacillus sp. DTU_2020_1001157_1_SI_ALB_TIR_016 TaxID=3077789 RepID=UPI0028E9616A|nr:PPK2 family polyphosphate kinase [Domibacillus sp. DTU_2020_1001157_1_SI_ALB_TIR_016]WNS80709.1 polyphosphate--nucleotide phosphotransferase [Domibacillus sp. DTU_2020_1001157_1_SI_ALB_TIR_016]
MDTRKYLVKANQELDLRNYATSEKGGIEERELLDNEIPERVNRLKELHWKLYAEEKKGILVVLQAMDAAGKDEAISYIFSNLNAQGLKTTTLGKPSATEMSHDYLWRIHEALPARGQIGILNRSHYEEVIATRVHDLLGEETIPDHLEKEEDIWPVRFRQINDFERYMVENGFYVVKFFFHVSKEEQRNRLLERMKDPKKNWEFSFNDVREREHWDNYQEIFTDMLRHTSTEHAPWYVLPADDEWYSRYIITEVMIELLEGIDPQFPVISDEDRQKLDEYIEKLENE